jgi:D-amino peptidase
MKIMIRSDMEGVSGVTSYEQVSYENPKYAYGHRMMMNDLNAVVEGLISDGDHEITIYDEHTDGRNIALDEINKKVNVICGKPLYRPDWGGIDQSFDLMVMVGFHACYGTPGALLPHTYSQKNLSLKLNGYEIGEIGVEAAIAGEFGVPTVLVTGDSAGLAEAQKIVPGIKTVTVKEALGTYEAICYPTEITSKLIFEAAREVVNKPPRVQIPRFSSPVSLEIVLEVSDFLEKVKLQYSEFLVGNNTVKITMNSVTEVWSKYSEIYKQIKSL